MTGDEFALVMAYITHATGKPLDADEDKADARLEVYYDLLGDLSVEVLQAAAKRVVLEHPWATFPSVAELRQAAADVVRGQVTQISSGEAWDLAWKAAGKIDPSIEGSTQRACEGLPSRVVEAISAYGIPALACGDEPVSIKRSQFVKIYEQLSERDHRQALLPAPLKKQIEDIGKRMPELGKVTIDRIKSIGHTPVVYPFQEKDVSNGRSGTA